MSWNNSKENNNLLVLTEEDYADFEKSTKSWICKDPFEGGDVKVKYQNWKIPKKIPRSRASKLKSH